MLSTPPDCDHGLGPVTGIAHYLVVTYRRPWRRLFRKTYQVRCWFCDVRVAE